MISPSLLLGCMYRGGSSCLFFFFPLIRGALFYRFPEYWDSRYSALGNTHTHPFTSFMVCVCLRAYKVTIGPLHG